MSAALYGGKSSSKGPKFGDYSRFANAPRRLIKSMEPSLEVQSAANKVVADWLQNLARERIAAAAELAKASGRKTIMDIDVNPSLVRR